MASPQTIPPPITGPLPALEVIKRNDRHNTRRRFIGAMPDKLLVSPSGRGKASQPGGDDESISSMITHHARDFFLGNGGREQDWDEEEERHVREEMFRRWKASPYAKVFQRKAKNEPTPKWVGSSFEIGDFLGVNLIHAEPSTSRVNLAESSIRPQSALPSVSFIRVPSSGPPGIEFQGRPISASSSTPLLPSYGERLAPPDQRPTFTSSSSARTDGFLEPRIRNGQGKTVHYDTPGNDTTPAPPNEVLQRSGDSVVDTSAGAAQTASAENQVKWGDVVMRDRMLCRVLYSKEDVGANFDEVRNITARHVTQESWGECLLVWRKERLEIYDDFRMPAREMLAGHKRLAHTIPLDSRKTKLSCYCFVDLTFCLTSPPRGAHSTGFLHGENGIYIYIFKARSRTRAADWIWQLWRQLDGALPPFIEVRVPVLDARLKIDVPQADDWARVNALFTRENLLHMCTDALRKLPEWEFLVGRPIEEGDADLALAWRMGLDIDWVWQERDYEGRFRDWAVTAGIALKQSKTAAHLEVRLGRHFPSHLHTKDGGRLDEPPGIEGYADRIRPNTQAKQSVYLATHDGNLFSLTPARADPPMPPGIPLPGVDKGSLRAAEVARGARQVMHAERVLDLRSVLAVRRAFQAHAAPRHAEAPARSKPGWEEPEGMLEALEESASDDEDEGGEEGLAASSDRPRTHTMRSFELLLKSGHVVRFEVYSRRTALEWIRRLRELILYWRRRHHIDARDEMDLAQATHPKLTPYTHIHAEEGDEAPEAPPDPDSAPLALGVFYNWCVLEGCRSIVKGGRLYERKGVQGQYKLVQMFLVSGNLVQYRITSQTSLHHRRKGRTIHLQDAYVCSGTFAAQALPRGQYDPNRQPTARRYQDGLEADDSEEDTLFIVWHVSRGEGALVDDEEALAETKAPALNVKRRASVFKTRSRFERDLWCWAINCEIEKIVRAAKEREVAIRDTGGLVKL